MSVLREVIAVTHSPLKGKAMLELEAQARVVDAAREAARILLQGRDTPLGNVIIVADAWGELTEALFGLDQLEHK